MRYSALGGYFESKRRRLLNFLSLIAVCFLDIVLI